MTRNNTLLSVLYNHLTNEKTLLSAIDECLNFSKSSHFLGSSISNTSHLLGDSTKIALIFFVLSRKNIMPHQKITCYEKNTHSKRISELIAIIKKPPSRWQKIVFFQQSEISYRHRNHRRSNHFPPEGNESALYILNNRCVYCLTV